MPCQRLLADRRSDGLVLGPRISHHEDEELGGDGEVAYPECGDALGLAAVRGLCDGAHQGRQRVVLRARGKGLPNKRPRGALKPRIAVVRRPGSRLPRAAPGALAVMMVIMMAKLLLVSRVGNTGRGEFRKGESVIQY